MSKRILRKVEPGSKAEKLFQHANDGLLVELEVLERYEHGGVVSVVYRTACVGTIQERRLSIDKYGQSRVFLKHGDELWIAKEGIYTLREDDFRYAVQGIVYA